MDQANGLNLVMSKKLVHIPNQKYICFLSASTDPATTEAATTAAADDEVTIRVKGYIGKWIIVRIKCYLGK